MAVLFNDASHYVWFVKRPDEKKFEIIRHWYKDKLPKGVLYDLYRDKKVSEVKDLMENCDGYENGCADTATEIDMMFDYDLNHGMIPCVYKKDKHKFAQLHDGTNIAFMTAKANCGIEEWNAKERMYVFDYRIRKQNGLPSRSAEKKGKRA